MVLHHVPQRAGPFVVTTAPLDAHGLGHGNLHVIDVAPIPDRLEDAVGEPERHDVLDGLLSQVVIDPIDLMLVQRSRELSVQCSGRVEVVPERLLDDDAAPPLVFGEQPCRAQLFDDRPEQRRRRREIEERVRRTSAVCQGGRRQGVAKPIVRVRIVEGSRQIRQSRLEPLASDTFGCHRAELLQIAADALPVRVSGQGLAAAADDTEAFWKQVIGVEVVQRRQQLALCQVAGRAEDHQGGWIGNPSRPLHRQLAARRLDSSFHSDVRLHGSSQWSGAHEVTHPPAVRCGRRIGGASRRALFRRTCDRVGSESARRATPPGRRLTRPVQSRLR